MQRVLLTGFLAIFLWFCALPRGLSAGGDEGLRKAHALFQAGDYDKAIAEYKALTASESHRRDALLGLAQVRMERGEYQQAEEACQQALRHAPADPVALGLLGQVLQATGRYKLARQDFEKAVRRNPNQLEARLALGKMQWEWGEHQAARVTLQPFIAYYRNNANLTAEELNLIAQACVYLERFRDANDLFYDATKADPKLWQAFVAWGELMLSKYNVADAQGIFQDALKVNPHAAAAHLGLAKCLRSTDFEGAKQEAEAALAINPGLVPAYDFLAELDILTGDLEAALQELEKPLKVNPNSLSTRALRAVCYYFLDDLPKYHEEERTILAVNPHYADVYFEIAESLARRYLFQESVEFYNKALALDPEHWAAHAGLGTSLSRLGEEAAAKAELEKAFSRDPY
ncbi:MAG: tetratricopeptide repeat protein, partial [Calditrichaeota bacterium]